MKSHCARFLGRAMGSNTPPLESGRNGAWMVPSLGHPRPRVAVVVFPGSNDDRDAAWALRALGADPVMVWHGDDGLPDVQGVVLPGGFSYGDYLRCGAIARFAPAMRAVAAFADDALLSEVAELDQIVLRYAPGENPNGSVRDVAGVVNVEGNVMGLMPHPEHAVDPLLGPA